MLLTEDRKNRYKISLPYTPGMDLPISIESLIYHNKLMQLSIRSSTSICQRTSMAVLEIAISTIEIYLNDLSILSQRIWNRGYLTNLHLL